MLAQLLGLPEHPLITFALLAGGGLGMYFALSGLSYLYFFVWERERFHPGYKADPTENRLAIRWGVLSVLGNAVLITPIHLVVTSGGSKLYWSVDEHGWGWLLISVLLYLVVTETFIYWIHRLLHVGPFYRYLHTPHHAFKVPTSWVSVSFNPLDSFLQGLPHHLCLFLFPVHIGVYLTLVTFVTVWAVMIHDGVSYVRWRGINFTGHHTLHHWYYDYNYGQFFTFWDRLGGTYRNPEDPAIIAELPPGVLARAGKPRSQAVAVGGE